MEKRGDIQPKLWKEHLELWAMALVATLSLLSPLWIMKLPPQRPEARHGRDERIPVISLPAMTPAALADLSPEERAAVRNLYEWCALKDPSTLLKPFTEYGFRRQVGSAAHPEHPLPVQEVALDAYVASERLLGQPSRFDESPLGGELLSHRMPHISVEMPAPAAPMVPDGVYWVGEDGHALKDPPRVDLAAVRSHLQGRGMPGKATRLDAVALASEPRVVLRESCGDKVLDQMAVSALLTHLQGVARKRGAGAPESGAWLQRLLVYWRLGGGES